MRLAGGLIAAALITVGCGIESQEAPSLIGPSGFGQSVTMNAVPDRLPRDGSSRSAITISVRNDSGQPVSGQRVTLGASSGSLSQADVVTGNGGTATFTLTAPPPGSTGNIIEVYATAVTGNFDNGVTRTLSIAITGPSNSTAPTPAFTINAAPPPANAPTPIVRLADVVFDASPSVDEGQPCLERCAYAWDFGDGSTATGRVATHRFQQTGTFAVRLTVSDAGGVSSSLVRTIAVNEGAQPTAGFTFSPADPGFDEPVFFDAALSREAEGSAGRYPIVDYIWNFGDEKNLHSETARLVEHTYRRPASNPTSRTYRVVLTVVDSLGRRGVFQADVTVGVPEPEPDPEP